jgi:hypothetical protein
MDTEGFIHRTDDPEDRARLEEAMRADAEGIAERVKALEEAGVDSERELPDSVKDLAARAAAATDPELEQAAEPGEADNNAHPHNDRVLAANGFSVIRDRCMTVAGQVPPPPAVEAAIRYLKASRAQALAAGTNRDVIDALDAELAQFEAVHKFGRALAAVAERFEARARITGSNGAGA